MRRPSDVSPPSMGDTSEAAGRGAAALEPLEPRLLLAADVVLSEIMYHPAPPAPGGEHFAVDFEYVELFNRGDETAYVDGWQFVNGIALTLPDTTIAPDGRLVVAANLAAFAERYPDVTNVLSGPEGRWDGRLSNSGEEIDLVDELGDRVDRARYADEGDWSVRERQTDLGYDGWAWSDAHDGGGSSLELINPLLSNNHGQNWAASTVVGGTPGGANSVAAADIPPLILDVQHLPAIPRPGEPVAVSAEIVDELLTGITATLWYRVDGTATWQSLAMLDDGASGDGAAGDGRYGAVIQEDLDDEAIVEFYVEAADEGALSRTWPAPVAGEGQRANALYVVDDSFDADAAWTPGDPPVYRLVMTDAEYTRLNSLSASGSRSHAQMNGTFIALDGVGLEVRYNAGIRNRGESNRSRLPYARRVNLPHDRPWKGVTAMNLNSQYSYLQVTGLSLFQRSGVIATDPRAVRLIVNGSDWAYAGEPTYGAYVHLEVPDSDFADNHFPHDPAGNVYKAIRTASSQALARLDYRGEDPDSYRNSYEKKTNFDDDNWTDLIRLTDVLNNAPDEQYLEQLEQAVNVDEWLRYFAVNALLGNSETSLGIGDGDDYFLYRGVEDPRFVLIPNDMDSIFGMGHSGGGDHTQDGIFQATALPAIDRFLTHPEIVPRYYAVLEELIETVFSAEQIGPFLDNLIGDWVPEGVIQSIETFMAARRQYVLSLIPQQLTVTSGLPAIDGLYRTTVPATSLSGQADAVRTRTVLVNGVEVAYSPRTGTWSSGGAVESDTLIASRSEWRFFDHGTDPGAEWYRADPDTLDPGIWETGDAVLGYGNPYDTRVDWGTDDQNKYAAAFFIKSFTVDDPSRFTSLTLGFRRDDGIAVYLNGGDPVSDNLSADAAWDDYTGNNCSDDGDNWHYAPMSPSDLEPGRNLIAAEVHQSFGNSSDLTFDLQLVGGLGSGDVALRPGVNRILVQALDEDGREIERQTIDVWYDDGDVQTVSGELAGQTTWTAAAGPYHVTGDVTVPAGATLTIEPGTSVYFDAGRTMTVRGRLVAEGSEYERIRMTRPPGSTGTWRGLEFLDSLNDSRVTYTDMSFASAANQAVDVDHSQLLLENVTWDGISHEVIEVLHPSLIVRNCVFPGISSGEVIHGQYIEGDEYLVVEGSIFGYSTSGGDVIDFLGADRPGPVFQVLNNVFLGGGDDGIDLDGTDAYVEGNLFMDFHLHTGRATTSNAIATGLPQTGQTNRTQVTVVRNVFYDVDHAVLLKEDAFLTAVNNVFVGASVAVVQFNEVGGTSVHGPGKGAYLEGNVFWDNAAMFQNLIAETELEIHRSLVPAEFLALGEGNVTGDPRLVDPAGGDFGLLPGSPALGTGPFGLDMGAMVPAGAAIAGGPHDLTRLTDAAFEIGGPGVSHYKYRLHGGDWSEEIPVGAPLELSLPGSGLYTLEAIGRNAEGVWQDEASAAARTWQVDTALSRVLINEVLAINDTVHENEATWPDAIELYNDSADAIDLGGLTITDDPGEPGKFAFAAGTTIGADGHLLLYADDAGALTPGIHLGFQLDGDGEGVYLYEYDAVEDAYVLLDSVEFGIQLHDVSIGRAGRDRHWTLTEPTLDPAGDQANVARRLGNPATLKVNEWLARGDIVLTDDAIELYNPDPLPVQVDGLFLTDHPVTQPRKDPFDPLSFVAGAGFKRIFADDGDRSGHVNFRLSVDHEMIALFDADGREIDWVVYGPQTTDVSQGRAPDGGEEYRFLRLPTPGALNAAAGGTITTSVTLAAETATKRVLVPTGPVDDDWRRLVTFDDQSWTLWDPQPGQPGGVGYEDDTGYESYIGLNVIGEMNDQYTSCLIRIPFTLEADPADITELTLKVRYDDGFVAYLNGEPVDRRQFAGVPEYDYLPQWNDDADGNHEAGASFDYLDITDHIGDLQPGENLLAIHGLNVSAGSTDFLICAELVATVETASGPSPFDDVLALFDDLRITEVMYNPIGASPGSGYTSSDFEFIELRNFGDEPLDLTGVRLRDAVSFDFPQMTLPVGAYVVVVNNLSAFESRYGTGLPVAGEYLDSLANGRDTVVLQLPNPFDAAALRFEYDDDWYPITDGAGPALVIADPLAPRERWDEAAGWRAGAVSGGSPGADEPGPEHAPGSIIINELLAHSDGGVEDWIELHNTTEQEIDLSGWFLSDSADDLRKFEIPPETRLGSGGYVVFDEVTDFGPLVNAVGFRLSELGDEVFLSFGAGGELGDYREFVAFGATANGVTLGRHGTTTGKMDFVAMSQPTWEEANADPLVGPVVISEIMYHPSDDSREYYHHEYILLRNVTDDPAELYDPLNPANTWRFADGVVFAFPEGVTVAPGGAVMVVPIEPDTFRLTYDVPAEVQVYGPYTLDLSNGGETIELARPGKPESDGTVPYIAVERVTYKDGLPWPAEADGAGPALLRSPGAVYGNEPTNWSATAAPRVQAWDVDRAAGPQRPTVTFHFSKEVFAADDDVVLRDGAGEAPLAEYFALSRPDSQTIVLTAQQPLPYGGPYTVELPGVTDAAGRRLRGLTGVRFVAALTGDADFDGAVGFADYAAVKRGFGRMDAAWSDGDFDLDGDVDLDDYEIGRANFGATVAAAQAEVLSAAAPAPAGEQDAGAVEPPADAAADALRSASGVEETTSAGAAGTRLVAPLSLQLSRATEPAAASRGVAPALTWRASESTTGSTASPQLDEDVLDVLALPRLTPLAEGA